MTLIIIINSVKLKAETCSINTLITRLWYVIIFDCLLLICNNRLQIYCIYSVATCITVHSKITELSDTLQNNAFPF